MRFNGCSENHKKTGKRYFVAFSGLQTTGERKEFAVVPQDNDPCVELLFVPPRTSPRGFPLCLKIPSGRLLSG
jgi:hypothetical protein